MKKLNLILAGLALAGAATTSMAGTATDNFDVTITFTGSCSVKTGASNMAFTYAAFDTAKTANTSTIFECSRGLTPTFAFDNAAGATSNGAQALATGLTAEGVISGIRYTLTGTSSRSTTGTAASAGAGGTGGSDGTADQYTVAIQADIAAGQAGTGAGGSAVTQTRTLTITY